MVGTTTNIFSQKWIDAARKALIRDGVAGVKVDRLASQLAVTRGGFYHGFRDRDDLLIRLLHEWEARCRFLPLEPPGATPTEAIAWFDRFSDRMVAEEAYDRDFDLAVRDWGRSDQRAAWAVARADAQRLAGLATFFRALGYNEDEAETRAHIFYYHQIGYYAIGVRQSPAERRRKARAYIEILCGPAYLDAVKATASAAEGELRTKGTSKRAGR